MTLVLGQRLPNQTFHVRKTCFPSNAGTICWGPKDGMVRGSNGTGTSFKHGHSDLFSLVWNSTRCSRLTPSEVMLHLSKSPKNNTLLTAQLQLSTMFCSVAGVLTGPVTKSQESGFKSKGRQRGSVQWYDDLTLCAKVCLLYWRWQLCKLWNVSDGCWKLLDTRNWDSLRNFTCNPIMHTTFLAFRLSCLRCTPWTTWLKVKWVR